MMSSGTSMSVNRPQYPIQFIDLGAQRRHLGERLDAAVRRVMEHGKYILGPEVKELETKLAERAGVKYAIGVSNGTDALGLVLMAWNVRPGDAVMIPDFTFAATAEVVAWLGATPIFCDVDRETYNLRPDSLWKGIAAARDYGLTPRAVIAVDLFGQPADYRAIEAIVADHDLYLLADAAQSFGANYQGRPVGSIGHATATSFFPAKPLGCYGDGGAVLTDDDDLAWHLRSLRVHGQGNDKYDNVKIGMNSRLDSVQAAILLEKLTVFDVELNRRETLASHYNQTLEGHVGVPVRRDDRTSAWAQYTVRVDDRATLAARLKADGVPTAIYYPTPLSEQTAYQRYPCAHGGTPTAGYLAQCVLSLPMHPYMDEDTQRYIINSVQQYAC